MLWAGPRRRGAVRLVLKARIDEANNGAELAHSYEIQVYSGLPRHFFSVLRRFSWQICRSEDQPRSLRHRYTQELDDRD